MWDQAPTSFISTESMSVINKWERSQLKTSSQQNKGFLKDDMKQNLSLAGKMTITQFEGYKYSKKK